MVFVTVAVIVVCVLFLIFWAFQFIHLMSMGDSDLPGRYDKVLWFILFYLFFLFAPFLFMIWKNAWVRYRKAEQG